MVDFYDPYAARDSVTLQQLGTDLIPATTGEVHGATFGQQMADNFGPRIVRNANRQSATFGIKDEFGDLVYQPEVPLDPVAANETYGIPGHLTFDAPVAPSVARDLSEHKKTQLEREYTISRREGGIRTGEVARFVSGLAAGALDPLNVAAAFVPIVAPARVAAMLAGAAGAVGRAGIRTGVGAIEGGVGMAALQPLEYYLTRQEREDFTMSMALRNIAFGAALGGGFHVGIGAIVDRVTGKYRNPITQRIEDAGPEAREVTFRGGLAQMVEGRPVDVVPAMDLFDAAERSGRSARVIPEEITGTSRAAPDIDPERIPARTSGETLIGEPVAAIPAHRIATAEGHSIDVVPIVVEARTLKTSADEGYDPGLQPRQRDRAAAEQQVREIAARLSPERLGASSEADRGAPIIGGDGMVESGNGRVMAIRQAYAEAGEPAARYRNWLEAQGVDVARYEAPVLVRQRTTPLSQAEREAFAVAANRPATLALSAPERAFADARSVTPDVLALLRNPDDLGAASNREFVRAFVGKLPQAEQGAIATADGAISAEGLTRVRNAVLASAYGDAALLARIAESTHDEIKSISNAMIAAAPLWAKLRSDIAAGLVLPHVDLTKELLDAVARTADLRARNVRLDRYFAQAEMFGRPPAAVENWMRMFYDVAGTRAAGTPRIAGGLKTYATEARKVSAERGLDLGLTPAGAADIQALAIQRSRGAGFDTGLLFPGGPRDGTNDATGGGALRRPGVDEPGGGVERTGGESDQATAVDAAQRLIETARRPREPETAAIQRAAEVEARAPKVEGDLDAQLVAAQRDVDDLMRRLAPEEARPGEGAAAARAEPDLDSGIPELRAADALVAQAERDAKAYEVAAACLSGVLRP